MKAMRQSSWCALPVHVVVLNFSAPGTGGADLVRSILKANSAVRILILAHSPSVNWVRGMLEAGAAGCLTKECAADELVAAIRTVREGRVYLSPALVQMVVNGYA